MPGPSGHAGHAVFSFGCGPIMFPRSVSLLLPGLRRAAGFGLLAAASLGAHACAPTVDEAGHGCPCDDSTFTCCNARCVPMATIEGGICPNSGADSGRDA